MTQDNKVKVTLTLEDKYLDLKYYKTQIEYWDGESISKTKQPCFKIGSLLLSIMEHLDNLGKDLDVEFKIRNNPQDLLKIQNISGQKSSGESRIKSALSITESSKDAKRIVDFISHHNCTVN